MRKTLLSISCVLGLAMALGACSKSDSNNTSPTGNPTSNNPYMTAKINGASFTANYVSVDSESSNGIKILYINGMDTTGNTMSLEVIDNTKPVAGTYTTNHTQAAAYYQTSSGVTHTANSSGQFVITNVTSTSVTGTFSFTCTDSSTVTNGVFMAQL